MFYSGWEILLDLALIGISVGIYLYICTIGADL